MADNYNSMEKNMIANKEELLTHNVDEANFLVSASLLVFALITFIVWVLNQTGVFILDATYFSVIALFTSGLCCSPYIILKTCKNANRDFLKYTFMIITLIITFIFYTPLSFHTIILIMLPLMLAMLYFDRPLIIFTIIGCLFIIVFGTIFSFYVNITPDAPMMDSVESLVIYAVIPRFLIFLGMSYISLSISSKSSNLLNKLILAAKSIKAKATQNEIILSLATLVESRDGETGDHVKRTSTYAELLVNAIKDKPKYSSICTTDYIDNLIAATPLHDIGKIAIPDSILLKPGKLTKEEFEIMKTHTTLGAQTISKCMANIEDELFLQIAREIALCHHEKWDGSGYPMGLLRESIPLCARIVAIADIFDALSQKRCYKEAFSLDESFKIIKESRGTHFDPDLTDAFLKLRPLIEETMFSQKKSNDNS